MTAAPAYLYMLASAKRGVIYIGVTTNLIQRTWVHKEKLNEGFTKKYFVNRLVYFEPHESIVAAIAREKQMKKWNRAWKVRLIEKENPEWNDLWSDIVGD